MLEQIIEMVKGQVENTVGSVPGLPADKKDDAIQTTTHSLIDGLKKYATPENLSALTSMLGMGGGSQAAGNTSSMAGGLEKTVVSALTSKVGLAPDVAQKIASTVIPAVMSLFNKGINDDSKPGFNLDTLVGGLSGKSSSGGNLMDTIGSFFGKK